VKQFSAEDLAVLADAQKFIELMDRETPRVPPSQK
jgi:hypothetical protein